MQICSRCSTQSPDQTLTCPTCQADLAEWSETSVSLRKLQENPRVRAIRIFAQDNCCPSCDRIYGTYTKDKVPHLPVEGCSHPHGCRCGYAPMLDEIYP